MDDIGLAGSMTLAEALLAQVRAGGQRIAVEHRGRQLTYAQLNDRVNRLCWVLVGAGVGRGDRVAILTENRPEIVELDVAAAKLGAITAPQNWRFAEAEIAYCLGLVEPRAILVSERYASLLARIDHGVPFVLTLGDEYEHALARGDAGEPAIQAEPEDGVTLIYTGGTTGQSKAALISQRAQLARAMINAIDQPAGADDHQVIWSPMCHISGADTVFMTLLRGAKCIIVEGFDAAEIVAIAARERLGQLLVVAGVVDRLIAEFHRSGLRPKAMRSLGVMPDLVAPEKIAELTTLAAAPWCNTFGATETGWPPASRGMIPIGVAPTSFSKTQSSFCAIRLVDGDDDEVPVGEPGEVAFRGPSCFSGYWRAPEVNAHEFRGGWFHMGDMLRRNPDGTLDYVSRSKYMIKSGAENIYPAEIERVLLASPRIADAVVVRKPDARWGEVPVAFVVKRDAALTEDEVVAACRGRIASYKLPKEVRFVADSVLQRTYNGKIIRRDLELILEREAAERTESAP